MNRRQLCTAISASLLAACVPSERGGPSVESGFTTAGHGLAQLILSPLMIVAGLLEGLIAIPYFVLSGLHELNRGLVNANAQLTLDETYRHAYGESLRDVPDSGDTGVVFSEMRSATRFFQDMMRNYGDVDAHRYVLTAIRTADADGYTLYAVCHRPVNTIQVIDKLNPTRVSRYTADDLGFYQPFAVDVDGRALDTVVDWAGMPRTHIRTQKSQAILMNLAANSILNGKRTLDYWDVERRWIAGQYYQISAQRDQELRARMGIASAPFYHRMIALS